MKYGVYNGVSWSTQTVDSSGSAGYASNVVMVDGSGNVDIVYDNEGASQIDVANWAGAGFAPAMGGNPVGKVQAPSGFGASAVYQTSVTWTWTDNAVDALGYRVYGGTSATGSYSLVASTATLGSAANSYTQTGLTAGTSYFAYAAAVNAGGVVVSSGTTVMTLPSAPIGTAFTAVYVTSATLSWAQNNGAGTRYQVYIWTFGGSTCTLSLTTNTIATLSGLSGGTTYFAAVSAVNANGLYSSPSVTVSGVTSPGAAPGTPMLSMVYQSSMTVAWSSVNAVGGYELDASTAANFTGLLTSSITAVSSATGLGLFNPALEPNTTYYVRVGALWGNTTEYAYTIPAATATLAAAPSGTAFTSIYVTSATVSWTQTNPPGTLYQVAAWTVGGSTYTLRLTSSTTATLWHLSADTPYFAQVSAINWNGKYSAPDVVVSSFTMPGAAPASPVISAVGQSSISVSWGSLAGAGGYELEASTSSDFAGTLISSAACGGSSTSLTVFNPALTPDTTYYLRVGAIWGGTTVYALTAPASTATLAAAPTGTAFTAIYVTSATIAWAPVDPQGSIYQVSAWAVGVGTYTVSLTSGTMATLGNLNPATTYFVQVSAVNWEGVYSVPGVTVSSATLPGPPPIAPVSASIYQSSITVQWGAVAAAGGYEADASTSPGFGGLLLSSITSAGSAASLVLSGVQPNTTYYLRVGAIWGRTTYYAPVNPGSVITEAAPPFAITVLSVGSSTISVGWSAGTNPPGTAYAVEASTNPSLAGAVTEIVSTTTAVLAMELPNTAYYVSVAALNGGGLATPSGVTLTTATLPAPLSSAPANLFGKAQSATSILWSWGTVGGAAGYDVYAASANFRTPLAVQSTTTFTEISLATNTAYAVLVAGENADGSGPTAASASVYTLAAAPGAFTVASVSSSTINVSWSAATNPPGTLYQLQISTNQAFAGASMTQTTAEAAVLAAQPNTAYFLTLSALNGSGVSAAADVILATTTLPAPLSAAPGGLSGIAQGVSSITWTWSAISGASGYSIYAATSPTTLLGTTGLNSFLESGLSTNSACAVVVAGLNADGAGPLSAAATAFTLAAPPIDFTLVDLGISSAAYSWSADANPGDTAYELTYWLVGGATTTLSVGTAASGTLTNLNGGTTYYVDIAAVNGAGVATPMRDAPRKLTTLPLEAAVQTVNAGGGVVSFTPSQGTVLVSIPAGTFTSSVTLTVQTPQLSALPGANSVSGDLSNTDVACQVSLSESVQPQQSIEISLSYTGVDLSQFDPADFVIAQYDPVHGIWVPLNSTVSTSGQEVTAYVQNLLGDTNSLAATDRLGLSRLQASGIGTAGLFEIMQVDAAKNLSQPKAYPDPFRPALGHTVITFANLPAYTTLKIYDILGEKVRELSAGSTGMAVWDAKNSNGNNVASGVYFVLAGSGSSRKTLKVAIQR